MVSLCGGFRAGFSDDLVSHNAAGCPAAWIKLPQTNVFWWQEVKDARRIAFPLSKTATTRRFAALSQYNLIRSSTTGKRSETMPRNWLRSLSDRLSAKPTRKQIRRTRKPGGATIQPLESRILLAAPRLVPGESATVDGSLGENIGVNGTVGGILFSNAVNNQGLLTVGSTSDDFIDPVTGVLRPNTSNGQWIGSLSVDAGAGDAQQVTSAIVPGITTNSPFFTR
jgi:hypothetical protein